MKCGRWEITAKYGVEVFLLNASEKRDAQFGKLEDAYELFVDLINEEKCYQLEDYQLEDSKNYEPIKKLFLVENDPNGTGNFDEKRILYYSTREDGFTIIKVD